MNKHSFHTSILFSSSKRTNHCLSSIALLLIHLLCPLSGTAGTVALGPEKDTALMAATSKDEADGGGADRIYAQKTQAFALLDFDLGSIAAPITGAVLKLTQLTNNTGNWDFQVYPMVYQVSNYSWKEGSGTNPNPSDSTDPADATGAASYRYRLNGTTDQAWKTASGTNLTNAAAGSALWAASIGSKSGTNYVNGTQFSITLSAAVLEQFRIGGNKHVTLGVYDATPNDFTLANNNFFGSRENTTPGYRPVLEVTSASTLEPGALFQNRMVLQRDQPIQLWGRGKAGQTVRIYFDGQETTPVATATVAANGNWATAAPARNNDGGISHTVKITQSGGESVTYSDVVMGDVYLASGQSNIARLMDASDYPDEISSTNLPLIRQTAIKVQAAATEQSEAGIQTPWTTAVRSNLNSFSRTAYFFAKNLHLANDVPVGIILAADGGQKIDRFLNPAGVAAVSELAGLKKHVELGGLVEYYDYFNAMIAPLNPYQIKAFIWYQGEASVGDGDIYRLKMQALVRGWRELWDVPFYYAQLPNYTAGGDSWTELRNVQRRFINNETRLGMAVTIDVGDDADLHPKNKQDVGARLALWARQNLGESVFSSGPLYNGHTVVNGQMQVSFIRANGGLRVGTKSGTDPVVFTNDSLQNFQIAGSNLVFYPATATISGYNVIVTSPSVTNPVHVRYCHESAPAGGRKLYNAHGLPASPFRTDESFRLLVNSGSGSSALVIPGQTRTINADAPPAGKVFDRWVGATTAELPNPTSATTTLTMPAHGVYLLATYR